MSAIARIFLVLYSLLLIAACAGVVALSFNDEEMLDLSVGDYAVRAFVDSSDGARWAVTVILGAIGLLGAISMVVALLPWHGRHRPGQVRIQRAGGGTVEITTSALEHLLHEEISGLAGVRQVSPLVRTRGDTIESEITLSIDSGANIAEVTSTVSEATGAVLREQVGATQVRRPTIRITYDEIEVRHPAQRPMAPPEGPLPPPPGAAPRRPAGEQPEQLSWQAPAAAQSPPEAPAAEAGAASRPKAESAPPGASEQAGAAEDDEPKSNG
jgi:hypothetical protein